MRRRRCSVKRRRTNFSASSIGALEFLFRLIYHEFTEIFFSSAYLAWTTGAKEGNMGKHGGLTDDGDDDSNSSGEMDAFGHLLVEDSSFPEPHVGMEFDSENVAKMFYEDYARNLGFCTRVYSDSSTSRDFLCLGDGLKKRAGESCGAMLRIQPRGENKWAVTKFMKDHSHTIGGHSKLRYLRPKRHFAATANSVTETFQGIDIVPSGIMYVSVDGNGVSSESNHVGKNMTASGLNHTVKNIGSLGFTPGYSNQRRTLGRDAQNLLDYFKKMQAENPGFYYAIQLDEENLMANAFWADSWSRRAYCHFGDAVILDTTYRVNQNKVPFAPFTGVNHHGRSILFGCALLFDESEATFVWLFKTFLAAMNDRAPVSLTTDKDRSIQAAVTQVFPKARHSVNKCNVLREGHDRMAHVCLAHPNFQVELYNCINLTETIEEFESFWVSILDKYDLKRNDWLQSIYDCRRHWVPVYCRDSFFAAIFPGLGFESSFFDGYVNQQTTLPMFFRQYERALENSFEREVEADFDTLCATPLLKTPSPMEKQAASLYTKRIFSKFQEELVETFVYTANRVDGDGHNSTFRVAKFENDQKTYFVKLNIAEMKGHESLTTRYNNLCKEAIRFAEEGAISLETYSAALLSLRGGKKVAGVKKSVTKTAPSSSQVGGLAYDDRRSAVNHEMTPLLWPRQDEIIRRFNLNDTGVPSQTLSDPNIPCLAPVSLTHDGGHSDNTSMTWVMENKTSTPANKVAVINLKLQDYGKTPTGESEVKFSLSRVTLEPMLRSMAYISEQLSSPANKVALINLKLQDAETTSGESEVKFQVSQDTLGAMLRSMAYIREQLSNAIEPKQDNPTKRPRK